VNASDRTAGAVVADITAMGFEWAKVAEQIDKATSAVDGFNASAAKTPIPTTTGTDTGGTQPFALGGVVESPTFFASRGRRGVFGEAGPEAILPLTRVNGRLGVAAVGGGGRRGDVIVNVHAPYSAPGQEIHIEEVVTRAAEAAFNAVAEGVRSGGSFSSLFGG
jgi:phage-related minor tail protein